ncbi:MAG: 4Fe-4S binding protein [Armatimonadetes bacterium]|nr:4Fe-4S binding protein [Armatimonadota bacterium]
MTVKLRRLFQMGILVLFFYLLAVTTFPLDYPLLANSFLRLSPLNFLLIWISKGKIPSDFLLPVLVVVSAILLGRFFCGWICPMGTSLDIGEKALLTNRNSKKEWNLASLKYWILAAALFTSLFGVSLLYLGEPISLIMRISILSFFPPLVWLWQALQGIFPSLMGLNLVPTAGIHFRFSLFFLALFLLIVVLGRLQSRFWCRNLCPMGALFAILGRFSLNRREVSDECGECGLCIENCKMGAIRDEPKRTSFQECIHCRRCEEICPQGAVKFSWRRLSPVRDPKSSVSFPRRELFGALAASAAWPLFAKTDFNAKVPHPKLIRPPASLPEEQFVSLCTRCGECMKVCVTNGLQPCILEGGWRSLWTPRLIPALGYCEETCNFCGKVCPTGAIQPFTIAEKKKIFMGLAVIDRSRCIAWNRGETCLICDEHCSYKAVFWKKMEGAGKPFVDPKKCVGCGICETRCPIRPGAAIAVYSQGEKRERRG